MNQQYHRKLTPRSAVALTRLSSGRYATGLFLTELSRQWGGEIELMANHKSAEKRVRQTERRNEVNSRNRSHLRTQVKKLRAAIESGKRDEARAMLAETVSLIDRSIQKGVLHQNAAARHKSRLTSKVNGMSA